MTTELLPRLLDTPVRASLLGRHARFARRRGRVLRYAPDLATFAALPDEPEAADWNDAAVLAGAGRVLYLVGQDPELPVGWTEVSYARGVQLVARRPVARWDDRVRELGFPDAAEIAALVGKTRPGPFLPRSMLCARYFGVRVSGALASVGGVRMRPDGHAEVSTVCTLPQYKGQGLARRLVAHLSAFIVQGGATPFLHAKADQEAVLRLYDSLGFTFRSALSFREVAAPADGVPPAARSAPRGVLTSAPRQRRRFDGP